MCPTLFVVSHTFGPPYEVGGNPGKTQTHATPKYLVVMGAG
jgi:hypothetical protein